MSNLCVPPASPSYFLLFSAPILTVLNVLTILYLSTTSIKMSSIWLWSNLFHLCQLELSPSSLICMRSLSWNWNVGEEEGGGQSERDPEKKPMLLAWEMTTISGTAGFFSSLTKLYKRLLGNYIRIHMIWKTPFPIHTHPPLRQV